MGFCPALVGKASEYGIKAHASNLRRPGRVRVIASGESESIQEFYEFTKKNDLRILQNKSMADYTFTEIKDYDGPDID